ncbi:tripartite tricarboxylate transporter permease [Desulfovibrio sp. OttesenSCG-928-O18]|nr:tripartite tricarboxylate transporter permease [Desulfovibrio sp. OttesenSCG-928-O18]
MFAEILSGIQSSLAASALIANVMGTVLGITFGALPGLTATMGVALLIPITFGMPPVDAFAALLGMYCGAIYGGSISAILVGTPGTVAAAATLLEGPKLTAKGQSRKALEMATFASFAGGIISCVALVSIAPLLAAAAMKFGPAEYFSLAFFGLAIVTSLSHGSVVKGIIAVALGLFLSTIGIDPVSGDFRNTFDVPDLFSGLSLVPALVGLFAVSQALVSLEGVFRGEVGLVKSGELSKEGLTFAEFRANITNILRSSAIGTFIGIIPATGSSASIFLAYAEAKRWSKHPEEFGKGTLEGIAATESSNNAVTGGALVPLMTLGLPGDTVTAIMLGALMIQGLVPGPLLFVEHTSTVYGIFSALFLANFFMLVFGLLAIRVAGRLVNVPNAILMPLVLVLCAVGSFAVNNSFFDVGVMAVLGITGYFMIKLGFPQAPMLLGMILGPLAESNFRRALSISREDLSVFVTQPISCVILIAAFGVFAKSVYDEVKQYKNHKTAEAPLAEANAHQ